MSSIGVDGSWWGLAQVLTWACTGELEKVLMAEPDRAAHARYQFARRPSLSEAELVRLLTKRGERSEAEAAVVEGVLDGKAMPDWKLPEGVRQDPDAVLRLLPRLLHAGAIRASGRRANDAHSEPQDIDQRLWATLRIDAFGSSGPGAYSIETGELIWRSLHFSSDDVTEIWPAPQGPDLPEVSVLQLRDAFVSWMQEERSHRGLFPGEASDKAGREGWRAWAKQNNVAREIVSGWIKSLHLSNPRGRAKTTGPTAT
jgi:hypothetical protein